MATITAVPMAQQARVDPKKFGKALREHKERDECSWHQPNNRQEADAGSGRHKDMERVLNEVVSKKSNTNGTPSEDESPK
jgi:hypothetical protein